MRLFCLRQVLEKLCVCAGVVRFVRYLGFLCGAYFHRHGWMKIRFVGS